MKPGPFIIYSCPECKHFASQPTLMSSNSFGANIYSDNFWNSALWPEFTKITKCDACKSIFWLEKEYVYGTYPIEKFINDEMRNCILVKCLSLEDFIIVLQTENYKNWEQEIFVRQYIWWLFNERIRSKMEIFNSESEKVVWSENFNALIRFFESEIIKHQNSISRYKKGMEENESIIDNEQKRNSMNEFSVFLIEKEKSKIATCLIKIAEINRNLGNFEKSLEILNTIEIKEVLWIKEQMINECQKKNDKVFLMKKPEKMNKS